MTIVQPASTSRPARRSTSRTVFRWLALCGLLLVLGVAGAVGADILLAKPPPPLLWTEQDLPPLPDAASNGWVVIQNRAARSQPPSLPSAVHSITQVSPTRPAGQAWTDITTLQPAVSGFVHDTANADWYATIDLSLSKPSFADACPTRIDSDCPHLAVLRAHQMEELRALDSALDGRWNDALVSAARLASSDAAFSATTRSIVSAMVSLARCTRAVDLIDVLDAGYRAAGKDATTVDIQTMRSVGAAIASVKAADMDLKRAVISEYLFSVQGLALAEATPGAVSPAAGDLGPLARFTFDRGETLAMLNDDYRAWAAYARAPAGPAPTPPPSRAAGSWWWMHNATGKTSLDMLQLQIARMIKRAADDRAELMTRCDDVGAKIATRLAP